MAHGVYNAFIAALFAGTIDADTGGDEFRIQLHTSDYTPDPDHSTLGDLTDELSTADGYTSGGILFASQSVTQDDANDLAYLDGDDPLWTNMNVTFRYAILIDVTAGNIPAAWWDFITNQTCASSLEFTVNAGGLIRGALAS